MHQINRQDSFRDGFEKLPVEATIGLHDWPDVDWILGWLTTFIQLTVADERCHGSAMNPLVRLVGAFIVIRVVNDQSAIEQSMFGQGQPIEHGDNRVSLREVRLPDFPEYLRSGQIAHEVDRTLPDRAQVHDVLALKQAKIHQP
jgi:hypothetical protein